MIQEKVRTSTYASSILFHDAVVLDVGCGIGILSLRAAKSGEKHVYTVGVSDIAEKAEQIVTANGLENAIMVICGKIEEISFPGGLEHVNIIVSERMGYALLYESMLDSVLHTCDRFSKPEGGVMALSQCRIMSKLYEGRKILKDRVRCLRLRLISNGTRRLRRSHNRHRLPRLPNKPTVPPKRPPPHTPRNLDFSSPFTLTSTAPKRTKIHAFVLCFDTFFTTIGDTVPP
ncbi:S-adenosyl-L-methionine-dependent methyltransferase, partial [Rhizopogon salebrosus TDB-379]